MPSKFNGLQISDIGYYSETYAQNRGIFNFNTTYSSNGYVQLKTNVGGDDSMWMFEAVGYNYELSLPVRSMWSWYSYGSGIYSVGLSNPYSGLTAHRVYAAGDGSSVIVAYASSLYYLGFTVNAYNERANATGQRTPQITASVVMSSDYNYY